MAATLLGAVKDRFDGSAAFADFAQVGGLWFSDVPDDRQDKLPHCVLEHEGTETEWTTEKDYLERWRLRFRIFGTGLASVESYTRDVQAVFDLPGTNEASAALTVAGSYVVWMRRLGGGRIVTAQYRTRTNLVVFESDEPYEVLMRSTLA